MSDNYEEEMEALKAEALAERDGVEEEEEVVEEESEPEETISEEEVSEDEEVLEEEETNEEEVEPEEDSEEEEIEEETEKSDFEEIEVNVNGVDVKITSKEEMMAYIQKGADAFDVKPETHVEEKAIIDQGKLSPDMLKLVVEAQNGSKEALAKIAQSGNIDLLEVTDEDAKNYTQKQEYYKTTEVDRVADEISANPEHLANFQNTVKALPKDFIDTITGNAETLRNFNRHVQEGLASEIIPLAITAQIKNGGSFMDNYSRIGEGIVQSRNAPKKERVVTPREKEMRTRAKSTSGNKIPDKLIDSGDDVWKMSSSDFGKIDLRNL